MNKRFAEAAIIGALLALIFILPDKTASPIIILLIVVIALLSALYARVCKYHAKWTRGS